MQIRSKVRRASTLAALVLLVALAAPGASAMQPRPQAPEPAPSGKARPEPSGIYDFRDPSAGANRQAAGPGIASRGADVSGTNITECPQAGLSNEQPQPLDLRLKDQVERNSDNGDDIRANQDYSCFPQDETSIAVNPRNPRNLIGGANDYRLGWGTSGFYASTDGGKSWYDGIVPFPSLPSGDNLDGGGDPALVIDRGGVAYYAGINFNRTDDTSGVFVNRSTNGGFTWTRPCVPVNVGTPTDDQAVCGGLGDTRQPGDGVAAFQQDNDLLLNASVLFNDKDYMAAGPRPVGVNPVCFGPETHTPVACDPAVVGTDRLYVTWTIFSAASGPQYSQINVTYSDDQGRSWSAPKVINGSAPFCVGSALSANGCDNNQGSVPTVNPQTGTLYVGWQNGNTSDEDQYIMARSTDGGNTFAGPFFVTPLYDLNYPRPVNGRTDCATRGQGATRQVLTNTCFRLNSYGNIAVDKRGGAFADDLYAVISDNRNGTIASSNADVFLFKSTDGGTTWLGPTRVNDDRSIAPPNRDCGRDPQSITGNAALCGGVTNFGNDQWFPWVAINDKGHVNVVFHDRRLDQNSTASEWPASRQRPGNYLAWFWGAQCTVKNADSRECVANEAQRMPQPTGPVDPGPDPVPGQNQHSFPFENFAISDVPFNLDYAFRAGLFMGDYNNVAVHESHAYGFWTDARNGRSSRNEPRRNPLCEQSDVFLDIYSSAHASSDSRAKSSDSLFLVTPCTGARN